MTVKLLYRIVLKIFVKWKFQVIWMRKKVLWILVQKFSIKTKRTIKIGKSVTMHSINRMKR